MAQQSHELEIYEPYEYEGPNPLNADGVGVLSGPAGSRYYLLSLRTIMEIDHEPIEQLLVQCRYTEDHIQRPTTSMCTVNIARVRPGLSLNLQTPFNYDDIISWGVGRIRPTNGKSTE